MLISSLGKGDARLILRVITLAIFFLVPIVGNASCRLRNQLKLLRNQNVTVISMTGWVSGPRSLVTAYKIRRLPAGFFGLLMVIAAALSLTADILVTRYVNTYNRLGRCPFGEGMVFSEINSSSDYPYTSYAYTMASNAQLSTFCSEFGGSYGIYSLVNNEANFIAQSSDTLGNWECHEAGNHINYNSSAWSDEQVAQDLIGRGLVYNNYNHIAVGSSNETDPLRDPSMQLFILSTSQNSTGSVFNVSIAIDLEDEMDLDTGLPLRKKMQGFNCHIVPNLEHSQHIALLDMIEASMNPGYLVSNWADPLQGNLYASLEATSALPHPNETMGWMLNSATMIVGSGTVTTDEAEQSTYGCLKEVTIIPNFVLVLVVLCGGFLVLMLTIAFALWIMVLFAARKYDRLHDTDVLKSDELLKSVPNGLVDWMVHAAQETDSTGERLDQRGLTDWRLTTTNFNNCRLGMVRVTGPETSKVVLDEKFDLSEPSYI